MAKRNISEQDFQLKADIRAVLWAQGYSTRLDVLLAYMLDPRGRATSGKAGLTDLDVLGVRLDAGFRVYSAVADCKSGSSRVPERLFWLSGVSKFFGSDVNLLVRSQRVPEHAPALARSLGLTIVGPEDLSILINTYVNLPARQSADVWRQFFAPELLGDALDMLARLPAELRYVEAYRESIYWMDAPFVRLQRIIAVLIQMSKDGSKGPTFKLVFADFVWLFVVALWQACEGVASNGISKLEHNLQVYISGNEVGLSNLQRVQKSFDSLLRRFNIEINLPLLPPYFPGLLELVARCLRRPEATGKMARRAEWLLLGQMIGKLGLPPGRSGRDDAIADKLLGDVARFLVNAAGLHQSFLESYLIELDDRNQEDKANPLSVEQASAAHGSTEQPGQIDSQSHIITLGQSSSGLDRQEDAGRQQQNPASDASAAREGSRTETSGDLFRPGNAKG